MKEKDIAVVILNYIQYINIIPGIESLIKKGYSVDIYCNDTDDNAGFKELFADIRKHMREKGYTVYECAQKIKYKVLLEPYPTGINIKSKYKIKYRYGNTSAKPNIVYIPKNFIIYDCILCAGDYDSNYLSVFSKTYKTGNQKYVNFHKIKSKKYTKKVLLYLPTYGKESSIELIGDELKNLRKKYYIIAKIHHGTSFLKNEVARIEKIKNQVDEFYDLHKNLSELLAIADVVLTDNSGSIFEAIYTEVPVAVFADDINKNKLNNFNTTQYELFKNGILPYTNDKNKIKLILEKAQDKIVYAKQKKWNQENFYHPKDLVKDFTDIIEKFINNDIDKRYFEMHSVLKKDYFEMQNKIDCLENEITNSRNELREEKNKNDKLKTKLNDVKDKNTNLKKENDELRKKFFDLDEDNNRLKRTVNYYKSGRLYKLANKLYKIKNGGK